VSLVQGEFRRLTLAVVQQAAEIEGLAMVEKQGVRRCTSLREIELMMNWPKVCDLAHCGDVASLFSGFSQRFE